MAIINSITVGKGKGSLGNVTLSAQKGRTIAKQKIDKQPDRVFDPDQVLNQNRFACAVASFKGAYPYVRAAMPDTEFGSQWNGFYDFIINPVRAYATPVVDEFGNVDVFGYLSALHAQLPTDFPSLSLPGSVACGANTVIVSGDSPYRKVTLSNTLPDELPLAADVVAFASVAIISDENSSVRWIGAVGAAAPSSDSFPDTADWKIELDSPIELQGIEKILAFSGFFYVDPSTGEHKIAVSSLDADTLEE